MVFNAPFFPNTAIMEAFDSRMGSYAWKSILKGRDIIQRRARWRIGNGEKINIWQHCLLPKKNPPQLPICPIDDFADSTVEYLIDLTTRHWLTDSVDGLFVAEDAEMRKKKKLLSQAATEDVLY